MKKMFTQKSSVLKLSVLSGFVAGFLSLSGVSYAQTYYSKFANPTGHYSKTDPTNCGASPIQNIEGLADNDLNTYASFTNNISTPYTCTGRYVFDVDLNLPLGVKAVQAGKQAGFRIKVSNGINPDSLGKYLTITTYLRDSVNPNTVTFQEYATGGGSSGSNLYGTNIDFTGKNWLINFTTTKPFNLVELAVDPKIIQLNTNFEFDVLFAFGGATQEVLPAQIANFKAAVSGKNVSLSWQSLTETNVSNYRIERSSNGGLSYSSVATIPAKGNSNAAISYGYTDNVAVDGNYLYRLVTVNTDGTSKATNSIAAAISGQGKLLLYPTIVKAGENVTVRTSETGLVTVYIFDAQGRMVKEQRTTSTGQFTVATNGLSAGVYNVKVVSASGTVLQSKIVIN